MKNNTLKKIGLMILASGIILGMVLPEGFAAAPTAPTGLTVKELKYGNHPGSNSVDVVLTWTDNSGDERCFKIYQSEDFGNTWNFVTNFIPPNNKQYTAISPNKPYPYTIRYRICAESNSFELSAPSEYTITITGSQQTYSIYGAVQSPDMTPMQGATVSFDQGHASVVTNNNGVYAQSGFANGNYNVTVTKDGYVAQSKVVNISNNNAICDFILTCVKKKKIVYVHGAGEFRPWKGCSSLTGPCVEIKTFKWGRDSNNSKYAEAGQKELPAFGDDLNQYMITNNIFDGSEVSIIAHSFGNLIVRQAMIRAKDQGLINAAGQPLYSNVHFIQVAPMIGGAYKAGGFGRELAVALNIKKNIINNMNPDGDIQKNLYDDAAIEKIQAEIGKGGKIDILLGGADTSAPPMRSQLFNKWLAAGLKEDYDKAAIVVEGKTHSNLLDAKEVCSLVTGRVDSVSQKPAIFIKDAKTTVSGKLILTLYNVGAPARNVRVSAERLDSRISIPKNTSSFGELEFGTGETRDNSEDPFTIIIPSGAPDWFFAPEVKFTIAYEGCTLPGDTRECYVVVKPYTNILKRIFAGNSLFPRTINFAQNIFERISSLARELAFAQEPFSSIQHLNAHPVLADLDKDGKEEVIIPFSGRKLYVLKSDGTDFWPNPYVVSDSQCAALYPVVADINNDGEQEIILAEYGNNVLEALNKNGERLWRQEGAKVGMPSVADIDNSGDGKMEIVVAKDGAVCIVDSEGRILRNKTGLAGYTPENSAAVLIDLNQDGKKEIITGDVCVLDKDGNILSQKTPAYERGASVADIDNDGKPEIITGRIFKLAGNNPADILTQWLTLYEYIPEYPAQIADLDGDGKPEVLTIEESGVLKVHYDISESDSKILEFSLPFFAVQRLPLALYDMDKDNKVEIVSAANSVATGTLYLLGLLDSQVELIDTIPLDYKLTHTPAIADINKDGIIELIAADLVSGSGNKLDYLGIGGSFQGVIFWPQFQRDTLRTGLYDIQPPQLNPIGNKTGNAGQPLSFTISATDQLVNKLSFSAYPLPQGAKLINNGNGSATFSWTPAYSQAGTHSLAFVVSDGALASSETINLTVSPLAAPSCLVVIDPRSSEIPLWWQDNSGAETGFKVERSTDGVTYNSFFVGPSEYDHHLGPEYRAGCTPSGSSCWSDAVACLDTCCGPVYNMIEYVDRGLDFGKKYYYRVRATINGNVDSGYSNVVSAITSDPTVIQFGFAGTIPVSGDYDGDGRADLAVYYPATGSWYIRTLSGTTIAWGVQWGSKGMRPVAGDYNGDGIADLALYEPASARWYIRTISGTVLAWGVQWGSKTMIPVSGDYDGDRKADLALFDSPNNKWYIRTLSGTTIAWGVQWGFNGTKPISGDYDGDGKADLAIYHPATSNWYIRTIAGTVFAYPVKFGSGPEPVSGDYNKDGKSELVVYNPANGNWYIKTLTR